MGKGSKETTIDVYVKLPSGKTTQFNLLPSDTVQTIYTKISEELGVSQDRLQIKYQGKVLKKIHSLGYLGVCRETILKAEVIEVKQWTVYVKLPSGETIPVELNNLTPVRHIKESIKSHNGTALNKQVLKISSRALTNMDQQVMDAGITNEAVLGLEVVSTPLPSKKKKSKRSDGASANPDWETGTDDDDEDELEETGADDVNEDDKQAIINSFDAAGRNVEVVFSFDTTGSMSSCLHEVRNKLEQLMKKLLADIPNIRIGIIAHGDYCDYTNYVVKVQDLTAEVDTLVDFAKNTPSTGGGDAPEAYEWVLHKAQRMEWSEDSAKALVVIGDDVPHAVSYTDQAVNWHNELDVLKGMGIKVYGVQAMNNFQSANFYQELAEQTGGAYVKFTNFSVLTDMFMAVCYREVDDQHLQNFQEELESQGNMTEEVRDMIQQIQEAPRQPTEQQNQRYVARDWWDPSLDHGSPQYTYNKRNDTWTPYSRARAATNFLTGSHWVSDSRSGSDSSSGSHKKSRSLKSRLSFRKKKSAGMEEAASAAPAESPKSGCSLM